jgi:hypothetical protein
MNNLFNNIKKCKDEFSCTINEIGERVKNDINESLTLKPLYLRNYKEKVSYEKRCKDSNRIITKHPEHVPLIVDYSMDFILDNKQIKFLIPYNVNVPTVIYYIRKNLKIEPYEAIFVFIDDMLLNNTSSIGEIYEQYLIKHKIKNDGDKYLYAYVSKENTFGKF